MTSLVLTLLLAGSATLPAERALVTEVVDGDTIVVGAADAAVTVELAEIDAPELDQPYGRLARETLAGLVLQREVVLVGAAGGRSRVKVGDRDVARDLLALGLAWSDDSQDEELVVTTMVARGQKLGLWQDAKPTPPSLWREQQAAAAAAAARRPSGQATLGDIGAQVRLRAEGDKVVIGNEIRRVKPPSKPGTGAPSGEPTGDPCTDLYDFMYSIATEMSAAMGAPPSGLPDRGHFLAKCHSLPSDIQECLSLSNLMLGDPACQQRLENAEPWVMETFADMGMAN